MKIIVILTGCLGVTGLELHKSAPQRTLRERTRRRSFVQVFQRAVCATSIAASFSCSAWALPPLNCNSFGCFPAELYPDNKAPVLSRPPPIESASSTRALELGRALRSKGATMFGAHWCGYCNRERQALGREAWALVEYVECDDLGEGSDVKRCAAAQISAFPTWSFADGTRHEGALGLDGLERLTGLPSPPTEPISSLKPASPPMIISTSTTRALEVGRALRAKGATMYGAYWCSYCNGERQALGREAWALINYVECDARGTESNLQACRALGVGAFPTWRLADGTVHEGALGLDGLARLAGLSDATKAQPEATY